MPEIIYVNKRYSQINKNKIKVQKKKKENTVHAYRKYLY